MRPRAAGSRSAGGGSSGTVNVIVNGDLVYETNETLSLTLNNLTDATVGAGTAQGTIANNDRMRTWIRAALTIEHLFDTVFLPVGPTDRRHQCSRLPSRPPSPTRCHCGRS